MGWNLAKLPHIAAINWFGFSRWTQGSLYTRQMPDHLAASQP